MYRLLYIQRIVVVERFNDNEWGYIHVYVGFEPGFPNSRCCRPDPAYCTTSRKSGVRQII